MLRQKPLVRDNGIDLIHRRDERKSPTLEFARIRHDDHFLGDPDHDLIQVRLLGVGRRNTKIQIEPIHSQKELVTEIIFKTPLRQNTNKR